jgi:hypothetical protein
MIVNHREKWLYLGPPRTGSTTLHVTLCYPEFGGEVWGGQHEVARLPDYRIFASASNPFRRIRSLYRYLTQNFRGHSQTFEDFCYELSVGGYRRPYNRDSAFWHWTLDEWTADVVVDRWFHLESLDADLRAEFPQWRGFSDVLNATTVSPRVAKHSAVTRPMVRRWAERDFALCGYPFGKGRRK